MQASRRRVADACMYACMGSGGSIQGLAAESSSFRYGLFHDVVLEIEAVLSDGTVLVCSRTSNAELFHSLPGDDMMI